MSGSRLGGIDGLRAIAALSIVVFHVWRYASPSGGQFSLGPFDRIFGHLPVGVTLFFTLSGFLLYRPFAAAILRAQPRPSIGRYLRNRALRILPAYWVILVITGVVLQTTFLRTSESVVRTGSLLSEPTVLLRDALLVQNYSPSSLLTGIGPAWSLAVEVVFYVVLPLLGLLSIRLASNATTRRARRVIALVPPTILLVVGVSGKLLGTYAVPGLGPGAGWVGDWHSVLERSFLAHSDLFAFGMALSVLLLDVEDGIVRVPKWWPFLAGTGVVLVAVAAAALLDAGRLSAYPYDTLMAVACALLVSIVVLPTAQRPTRSGEASREGPNFLVRLLNSRVLAWIGLVSYSLFLWHEPLIRWLRMQGLTVGGGGGFVLDVGLVVAVGLGLSTITFVFVEAPALAHKVRVQRGTDVPPDGQRVAAERPARQCRGGSTTGPKPRQLGGDHCP
jgi:peptidoglycan/LPS O-acetylase OafA/YrhL